MVSKGRAQGATTDAGRNPATTGDHGRSATYQGQPTVPWALDQTTLVRPQGAPPATNSGQGVAGHNTIGIRAKGRNTTSMVAGPF